MAFLLKKCFGRGVPPLGPLEKPLLRQRWGHNFRNRWGHNFSCVPIPLRSFQTGTGLKLLSPRPTPKQGKALQLPLPKRSRGHDFSRVPMPPGFKDFQSYINLSFIFNPSDWGLTFKFFFNSILRYLGRGPKGVSNSPSRSPPQGPSLPSTPQTNPTRMAAEKFFIF
jgi:hypothetical protein